MKCQHALVVVVAATVIGVVAAMSTTISAVVGMATTHTEGSCWIGH